VPIWWTMAETTTRKRLWTVGESVVEWVKGGSQTHLVSAETVEELAVAAGPCGDVLDVRPRADDYGVVDAMQMWPAFHRVQTDLLRRNRSPPVSFEVWNDHGDLHCTIGSPEWDLEELRQHIEATYREANVSVNEPGVPFAAGSYVASVGLPLRRRSLLPIRRYDVEGFESDPYGPLLAAIAGNEDDSVEVVCVQAVAKPATHSWTAGGLFGSDVGTVAETLRSSSLRESTFGTYEVDASKVDRQTANVVQAQRGLRAFHVDLRVVVQASSESDAVRRASSIAQMFERYYTSQVGQGFERSVLRGSDIESMLKAVASRSVTAQGLGLLSVPELAGIGHVPGMTTLTSPTAGQEITPYDMVPEEAPSFEGGR
jgi:hypothetical protein